MTDMLPSPEGYCTQQMAMEVLRSFRVISKGVPAEVLGPKFDSGLFLHSRLSLFSRVFHSSPEFSSLVPIADLFNHSPDHTCDWVFDADTGAMVLTANRAHAAGEQIWTTYGMRPNPVLLRTYGFTLPPQIEPCWSYVLQTEKPKDIYLKFLPSEYFALALNLDTRLLQESLIDVLNVCAKSGHDAAEFLLALCSRLLEDYEHDESLKPALAALRRARSKLPSSAAWWDEIEPRESSAWAEAVVSAKMSEYLCLTAHVEFCEWDAGRLTEDRCLEAASTVREILGVAFDQLRKHGMFHLITTPKAPDA